MAVPDLNKIRKSRKRMRLWFTLRTAHSNPRLLENFLCMSTFEWAR